MKRSGASWMRAARAKEGEGVRRWERGEEDGRAVVVGGLLAVTPAHPGRAASQVQAVRVGDSPASS